MNRVAIIPARGGSEGIPGKNISDLFGIPLILWTVYFSLKKEIFDLIIVSTDSEKIANVISDEFNVNSNFLKLKPSESYIIRDSLFIHRRLDAHSGSNSKTSELILDIVNDYALIPEDLIFLMQPTSPFREEHEVDQILALLAGGASHVVSVKRAESPHPKKTFQIDESGKPRDLFELSNLESPRQALGDYFAPDGAYYATTVAQFLNNNSFISPNLVVLHREGLKTLNIDSPNDLEIANLYAPFVPYPKEMK